MAVEIWVRGDPCEVKSLGIWRKGQIRQVADTTVLVRITGVYKAYEAMLRIDSPNLRRPEST